MYCCNARRRDDSPNRISLDRHSSLTDLTQRSAYEFRFGLLAGNRSGFTLPVLIRHSVASGSRKQQSELDVSLAPGVAFAVVPPRRSPHEPPSISTDTGTFGLFLFRVPTRNTGHARSGRACHSRGGCRDTQRSASKGCRRCSRHLRGGWLLASPACPQPPTQRRD